ncbi:Lrp/AsnC family transcriptional regulator [Sphingobium sp. AP49]|uniref:Lrp/AsnC family transcriptional regulator n=1 Tax=Sphingobium sp. AP49 TaxID=1144307 RepID=UPI000566FFB8|nr:Lrp/AsnC family transcriptional regulator [Sphingobium sp. AP49]WHO38664.1 Lrp/AsnC family transcriptional regulator [Sphingobium sp. AP49]
MPAFRPSKVQAMGNIIIEVRKALLIGQPNATITHIMAETIPKLDDFDRAILRLVQRDNRMPQRAIAEAVNLSTAALQRRIAAMERSGVIVRNVAIVDPDQVGLGVTSIVEVNLVDEKAARVDKAKQLFRDAPEVQQCYYVTGGRSFIMLIVAPDMRSYEAITRRLFAENESVASYHSYLALNRVKAGMELVIP